MIERVVLGVFGEKTWFLGFIKNLGREVWTMMPPVKIYEVRSVAFLRRYSQLVSQTIKA